MSCTGWVHRLVVAGLALFLSLTAAFAAAQVCVSPQKDGNKTTTAGEVVNGYYTPANGSYSAGSLPTIALSNARGASGAFAAGDMALVIQMQCVDINQTDTDSYGDGVAGFPAFGYSEPAGTCRAGNYEYVAAGVGTTPTSFVVGAALQKTYVQADPTFNSTRRSFQIVRVPQYANLTLGGQLNALVWDGLNGGVVAVDVTKNTNFAGQTIFAAAQGFRGAGGRQSVVDGNNPYRYNDGPGVSHAGKGEGIAGTPPLLFTDGSPFDRNDRVGTITLNAGTIYGYPGGTGTLANFNYAKGAPGTAGGGGTYRDGNYHNGAGGGGGNGGAGGRGAFGWRGAGWAGVDTDYANIVAVTGDNLAAFPGSSFGGAGVSRVVLGGGGGAGDQNGNSGGDLAKMSGGTGGGIVFVRSGSLSGNGTIDVRGGVANTNPDNDAAGAGAAGGSAVVISPNWTSGLLTVNAGGGQGGDSFLGGNAAHSGGGGGGGGVVVRSGPMAIDISGGTNGNTNTGDSPPGGAAHGALPGNNGLNLLVSPASNDPVTNSGYRCLPQTDLAINKSASPTSLSVGQTTTFTLTISNSGPAQATAATVIDGLPAGLGALTFVSASGSNAATTLTASNITGNTFTGTITLPVNQILTILIRATAAANGAPVNQATVFAPTNASDATLTNNISTATVVIGPSADLSATKVASTPSLAVGQTTTFTLTFVNSGPSAVTGAALQDILPASMRTLTFVSSAGLNGAVLTNQVTTSTAFNGTATLPVASTLTIVLQAVAGTVGTVVNTATIAPPAGITDTSPGNNTGTAVVNIGPQADLSISKSATPTVILDGQTTSFTLIVRNLGPTGVINATVRDTLPSGLFGMVLLSATGASGGTLTVSTVSSSQFNGTFTLPANSSVTVVLRATAGGVGTQVNRATVTAPIGTIDPAPANNTAQATVTIPISTSLGITKTNNVSTLMAGQTTSYTVTAFNDGPGAADGSIVRDPVSPGLSCTSVTCTASGGAICPTAPISIAALQGAGLSLDTFPASSNLVFAVICGVTATGL